MLNKVCLMGRMVRDPELRTTGSGVSVTNFTIAVDRDYKSGENREADFITCQAWRNAAEFIAKNFSKGRMIAIEGALQTSSYTNKEGNKISRTEVVVNNAYFADSKPSNPNSQGGNSYGSPKTPKFEEADDLNEEDLPF